MRFFRSHGVSPIGLLIEVVSIIFGVLIALGVNEVRQHYKQQATVDIALKSISNELTGNKQFLEQRMPYYKAMRDTLNNIIARDGADARPGKIPGFNGINPPLLGKSSLQTAISTRAFSYMDFRKADYISRIYAFQDLYINSVDKYMTAVINNPNANIKQLRNTFGEMTIMGEELIGAYGTLLENLTE